MTEDVIDYTEQFNAAYGADCLAVHARGTEVLVLSSRLERPRKRVDGRLGAFELENRWLSQPAVHPDDQAFACVQGSDYCLVSVAEGLKIRRGLEKGETLFDHACLF